MSPRLLLLAWCSAARLELDRMQAALATAEAFVAKLPKERVRFER